eukprot:CAMPEP_0202833240 /NCGR_PEP_ID=MMETSP1389-20130828/24447_1 /ASSEMBLY_ACC=CAM_ASM_000865 /TAXON_ID=302021 /ORGANISM="Rhodomonas sp., Strain CCMP768" /LENGTH=72 /DNA_ID=CAMNT_0049507779 /DNA_START=69 /DNA_END=283 /DNA_ORIENTATION=-
MTVASIRSLATEVARTEGVSVEEPVSTEGMEEPVSTEGMEEPVSTERVEEPVSTEGVSLEVSSSSGCTCPGA